MSKMHDNSQSGMAEPQHVSGTAGTLNGPDSRSEFELSRLPQWADQSRLTASEHVAKMAGGPRVWPDIRLEYGVRFGI